MGLDDAIIDGKQPHLIEAARAVAAAVESVPTDLTCALKWGKATFAVDGDFHHWICAIGITRRAATLTFHFGGILDDPNDRLIAGTSTLLRRLEYRDAAEVDGEEIVGFVNRAVEVYPYFTEHWRELT